MSTVNSVQGPIDTSEMGFTLSHEHVLITSAGIQTTFPEFVPRQEAIGEGIELFKQAKAEGVDTIFDLTTHDLGRDILCQLLGYMSLEITTYYPLDTWIIKTVNGCIRS